MRASFETIAWTPGGTVRLLDQTRLPLEEIYVECRDWPEVAEAIRLMRVRGAPAIGVAGGMGMALAARGLAADRFEPFLSELEQVGAALVRARPTAVNLRWGIERILEFARKRRDLPLPELRRAIADEARRMRDEDIAVNRAMGAHGQALVPDRATILTHCNAGALATAGYGTALGVIRAAVEAGKRVSVLAGETRPWLQGARLTAWELQRDGIPVRVIADAMAASLMRQGRVQLVVVGADRIAANGDVANKIGTYAVALLARAHGIPFYVAAPASTFDLRLASGAAIPIEERDPEEVTHIAGVRVCPPGVGALNPVFDVTPAEHVTAIITERGILRPPYPEAIRARIPVEG
jgi:methylthioribose-1-phosphate isomerase